MYTILNQFESYLFAHKRVSPATYRAYIKDVSEFIDFLVYHNRTLENITEQDFNDLFSFLKKRRTSLASAMRKASALKFFARFLHEELKMADYSGLIAVSAEFPLLCNTEKITQLLQYYAQQDPELMDYKELRKYIILYISARTKMAIRQLVELHTYDICYQTNTIRIATAAKEKKEVALSADICHALKHYVSLCPYQTTYLFPVKAGFTIRPMARQAVWSFLRSLFNHVPEQQITRTSHNSDSLAQQLYRQKHPRS